MHVTHINGERTGIALHYSGFQHTNTIVAVQQCMAVHVVFGHAFCCESCETIKVCSNVVAFFSKYKKLDPLVTAVENNNKLKNVPSFIVQL